ncbi:MAG: glycosyltransferase family 1 protein [Acidobacteriota bacterium]
MSISRRPRLAVDLRALVPAPTGIGVYTRSLLLELARRGAFELVGMAHREPHFADELRAAGVEIEIHAAPLGVLWQQLHVPRRLRRGDIDLFWSPITTLPSRLPVPGVVTVHDLTAVLLPEMHRFKVRWSVLPFLRRSLEEARAVVVISQATARDVRAQFPQCAAKVHVIYPGVDAEFCPAEPADIQATRAALGAPEGYLLCASTLEPRKGIGLLLDAWEALRSQDAKTPPLVLAGGYGWKSEELVRRIESLRSQGLVALGRIPRQRLLEVMQGARLFIYPSLYEGFGFPPAEALACGVPAIVADSTSLPEVVGDAGIKVPPGDPAALAGAIRNLLSDGALESRLRSAAVPQAARFRWSLAAEQLEAVLLEALR